MPVREDEPCRRQRTDDRGQTEPSVGPPLFVLCQKDQCVRRRTERQIFSVLCRPSSVLRTGLRPVPVLGRPGGPGKGHKPDPIPNSAVKPLSAHGTKPQGLGESVAARPAKHRKAPQCESRRGRPPHTRPNPSFDSAGWSSPVARQAHNLKVAGSNPAPATTFTEQAVLSSRAARSLVGP